MRDQSHASVSGVLLQGEVVAEFFHPDPRRLVAPCDLKADLGQCAFLIGKAQAERVVTILGDMIGDGGLGISPFRLCFACAFS